MKIGLFGGTFNPIHNGHLKIARKVLNAFELAKIIFIPSGNPPHKSKKDIAGASHRMKMLKLAIAGERKFEVSDIEIRRKGISYTLDTIKEIKKIYGKDAVLYFIAGLDMALDLPNWKDPSKVLNLARFIAVERPGLSSEKLPDKYHEKIIFIRGISIDVSSSDIRKRVKEGKTIKTLVPEAVEKYIKGHNLFI
jgi:nicotinate-nucleotide adenylyltransferase